MYHQHALVKPRNDANAEELRRTRRHRDTDRRSEKVAGPIRASIARTLMLTRARLHGPAPAVTSNRVILLEPHNDQDLHAVA